MTDMKLWYRSKTVWGAIVAILASLLQYGGIALAEDDKIQIADAAMAIAGAVGGLLALYGRVTAVAAIGAEKDAGGTAEQP